jgi:hypothetical protein
MKTFIISLLFVNLFNSSFAADSDSGRNWVETNTVLFSNPQSPELARRDCDTTMRILSIMNNEKIVFHSECEPAYNNPRCNYHFCYKLSVKALFIEHPRTQE